MPLSRTIQKRPLFTTIELAGRQRQSVCPIILNSSIVPLTTQACIELKKRKPTSSSALCLCKYFIKGIHVLEDRPVIFYDLLCVPYMEALHRSRQV